METNSFVAHIKTEGIYEDIVQDVENRFEASNYESQRSLPK